MRNHLTGSLWRFAPPPELIGRGEAARITQVGQAEADVFNRKIATYGDPRLFALQDLGEKIASSKQPLVPEKLMIFGGGDNGGANGSGGMNGAYGGNAAIAQGRYGPLLGLLLADRASIIDQGGGDKGSKPAPPPTRQAA